MRIRAFERSLRSGTRLVIYVMQKGRIGKYTRFTIRAGKSPARKDLCVNGSRPSAARRRALDDLSAPDRADAQEWAGMLRSWRLSLPACLALVTLGGAARAAPGAASAPASVSARAACAYTARLRAPTHRPKANRLWKITVTTSTRRLTSAHYEFFFNGQKVSTQYVKYNHHFKFRKRFSDPTIKFPARAVGYPLVFRVVLHNACGARNLNYAVYVRR